MVLTPHTVRSLMSKHGLTIRGVAARWPITMKRVRAVRDQGVAGFMGDDWFRIITGHWPEKVSQLVRAHVNWLNEQGNEVSPRPLQCGGCGLVSAVPGAGGTRRAAWQCAGCRPSKARLKACNGGTPRAVRHLEETEQPAA